MLKYGLDFQVDDELQLELECIARGAKFGVSMFHHFMEARRLAWPHRYRHKWTDLMYRNFIDNDVTVLMGCASSQKTSHAVEFSLINYWARPLNTLVVLSTINMDKLDIGVWAELQMLWKSAKDLHPWLEGNILSHKRAITTDNLEDKEGVRDFRVGCICRPCFPTGTLVDTPTGKVPIERLKVGDEVLNAAGIGRVKECHTTIAPQLVRITLADGKFKRLIECTPEHPFLTESGWVKAVDVRRGNRLFSPDETLRILQGVDVSCEEKERSFLRLSLLREMEHEPTGEGKENAGKQEYSAHGSEAKTLHFVIPEGATTKVQDDAVIKSLFPRRHDECGIGFVFCFPRGDSQFQSSQTRQPSVRIVEGLPNRSSLPGGEAGGGVGWPLPPTPESDNKGLQANRFPELSRVDSVEILEQDSFNGYEQSKGGYTVHNLAVTGHPSYCVNGVVVHNCYVGGKFVGLGILAGLKQDYIIYVADELQFMQESFSKSWPHLFANGNVKIIGSGNPKHDPYDELGKTAEPKDGWNSLPEPTQTTVWETKYMGAKCVNLVGTDSPNFSLKSGQPEFPRLIGPKFAQRIEHDNEAGKESFEYYRLVRGVMKVSFASSRVIDRPLCINHKATEQPEWKNDIRKGVYGLDPTYGGEDRCVGIPLWFGLSAEGVMILHIGQYKVFPINLAIIETTSAERQIADILEQELLTHKIDSTNVFYDSTGKGTIGNAFALKFGHAAPVAVDSGAMPTQRPVRDGLMVMDDSTKQMRLKTCREHYSKFVSEMWFSVRYAIESEQVRGLQEDVMLEGCARVYKLTKGNKIEVEPKSDPKAKEDLKRRLGKSPDLFDALAIGFEGARQRGFNVAKLSNKEDRELGLWWLTERADKHRNLVKSKMIATR